MGTLGTRHGTSPISAMNVRATLCAAVVGDSRGDPRVVLRDLVKRHYSVGNSVWAKNSSLDNEAVGGELLRRSIDCSR